ncbi:MAG: hypothetical protein ACE5IR_17425 [bacterium]
MRIGEIAIVGPDLDSKKKFISAVCDEIVIETKSLIFGRLQINDQLLLHLYGAEIPEKESNPAWELVSRKLLGYIILFNWNSSESYSSATSTIDSLTDKYNLPLVIAADIKNGQTPVPNELLNAQMSLTEQGQFTFCKLSDPESAKKVLIMLINSVLERMN